MRAFMAIDLIPELKLTLEALIRNIRKNARGIKWVGLTGMHLTLKFLGDISSEKAADITTFLKTMAKRRRPFPLRLRGTGIFPPGKKKNARVLWAGIQEEPGLLALQEDIETGLENLGFPRENRPFHPHLTLGRVKFPEDLEPVLAELEKYEETEFGEMTVRRVTFFESVLKPDGAHYSIIAEVDFE